MTKKLVLICATALMMSSITAIDAHAIETEGYASWYGPQFQGKLTADGEIFDTNKFTAAHKTLPFGSIVKVTNLTNHRSVVVRINDRGPYWGNRIIDLTHAAAKALGMLGPGVAKVKLDVLHRQQENSLRTVQVAAFGLQENASQVQTKLTDLGLNSKIENSPNGVYRVVIPSIPVSDVASLQKDLTRIGYPDTLVRLY